MIIQEKDIIEKIEKKFPLNIFKNENHNLLTGYEGETILNDYDFMIKIIREYNWENVKFASKDLRNNKDFMRSAIRVSSKAKSYLGDKLLEDESFMEDIERL